MSKFKVMGTHGSEVVGVGVEVVKKVKKNFIILINNELKISLESFWDHVNL